METVAKMEDDYSFWMSQFKEQTRALATRRAAGDGESAAQELKETKEALNLASKEVANARAELSDARQFFLQCEGSNASISSGNVINCDNGAQVDLSTANGGREGGRDTMERFSPVQRKEQSAAIGHIEGDSGTESEDDFSTLESGLETAQVPPPIHSRGQVNEQNRSSSTQRQQELAQSITRQDFQLRSMPIRDVQQRSLAQSSLKQKYTPSRASPQQQEALATSVKRQKTGSTRRPTPPHRSTYERKFQWKEDGEMHHFPEEMSIPLVPLLEAWLLWCCGNAQQKHPPYRILQIDSIVKDIIHQNRFSAYRCLMRWMAELTHKQRAWPRERDLTPEEATEMLDFAKPAIAARRRTCSTSSNRDLLPVEKLQWTTVATIYRRDPI